MFKFQWNGLPKWCTISVTKKPKIVFFSTFARRRQKCLGECVTQANISVKYHPYWFQYTRVICAKSISYDHKMQCKVLFMKLKTVMTVIFTSRSHAEWCLSYSISVQHMLALCHNERTCNDPGSFCEHRAHWHIRNGSAIATALNETAACLKTILDSYDVITRKLCGK